MKVVLTQHVKGLGQKGEVKEVSAGYFANFLSKQGLARQATNSAIRHIKNQKAKSAEKLENMKESALSIKSKLDKQKIELLVKVNPSGKLYAALSPADVVKAISEQLKLKIPASSLKMQSIKELGEHEVSAQLYSGVKASFFLSVRTES